MPDQIAEKTTPWQLRMFQKTLKKRLRLQELQKYLGNVGPEQRCLLVTCGDNNGAMNHYLREIGGEWEFADLEDDNIAEMSELLGATVHHATSQQLPFADAGFDYVVAIDVHEHQEEPVAFTREMRRVVVPGGRIIATVPGGDQRKIVNRLKEWLGMTRETYGHVRHGYQVAELQAVLTEGGLKPSRSSTFSRFFTEMIELGINFLYVKVLSRKSKTEVKEGTIAPQSQQQLKSVEKSYRLYSLIYPFVKMVSALDKLLFFTGGYVTVVEATREAADAS